MFRNFKVRKSCCFYFPCNETDVSSTKWLQPTRDETNKRVSRSSSRVQPTDPGYNYVMIMEDCEDHKAPPFAKVGWSSNCDQRRSTLNVGNPHELTCAYTWWVSNMKAAEDEAKAELRRRGLRLNCDGGSEWFRVEGGLDYIDDFAKIVRKAIKDYTDEESEEESEAESSEEEGDRGLVVSSINRAPNQAAAKMATNCGHNNTKWRQDLKGNMLHVKYNCK